MRDNRRVFVYLPRSPQLDVNGVVVCGEQGACGDFVAAHMMGVQRAERGAIHSINQFVVAFIMVIQRMPALSERLAGCTSVVV